MKNIITLIAMLLSVQVFAGKISGKISDEKTGEAIIGATVLIKGTSNGTATDIDGNFSLSAAAGSYTLVVKYIGYQTKEIDGVVVSNTASNPINIVIAEAKSTELEEVVVRSSLKKETINALYSIQKNAATISDGISTDVIKKSPDRSTGEVLKRVSGTSIQDNKFVIIRGLSDRYNTAMIDNSVLPSTEPNRKAFSFDIIPAAMIDNIIISKAATPDLPGDFAGGAINILTKETPDENFNSLSLGLGYNTASTGKTFKSGYRTSTDFLGFDDGSRQLPSSFPSSAQVQAGLTQQQSNAALSSLNNNYTIKEHKALPGLSFQGALGRVYRLKKGNKFGFTTALTYNHNETIKENLIRQYDGYDYKDNVYNYSSNLGALLNAGYYFGNNKIVFKTIYNRVFDDNFLYRTGTNNSSSSDIKYYAFDALQKSLLKTSLEGNHQIGKGQSKLNWLVSYNIVTNNQPDQRKVSYSRTIGTDNPFEAENTTLGKSNSRLFGDLKEHVTNANLSYSLPFTLMNIKSNLKVGAFTQYRHRDVSNRYTGAVLNVFVPDQDQIRSRDVQTLFDQELINNNVYKVDDITSTGDKYKAYTTNSGGFVMLDNKFNDRTRLVWGARFESYHLNLKSGDEIVANPTWSDILPSANFTYSLNDKTNIRASYFRSVARPELREVAPLQYYDYDLNASVYGNPSLTRSQIDNLDLRYEIYPHAGEIISFSVFYKYFNHTIENQVFFQASSMEITTQNFDQARNIGAEIEIRKNLGFIKENSFFKNMDFYANLAYIDSKIVLGETNYANDHPYNSRPLTGQSPYVINTSLGYRALNGKLNFNLLYNRIGQRLFLVAGNGHVGHAYESARNLLDFQTSLNLGKKSELRLNIKDLLNNPVRIFFDQDLNNKFEKQTVNGGNIDTNKDYIFQEYKPGTTFSLTYTYRF